MGQPHPINPIAEDILRVDSDHQFAISYFTVTLFHIHHHKSCFVSKHRGRIMEWLGLERPLKIFHFQHGLQTVFSNTKICLDKWLYLRKRELTSIVEGKKKKTEIKRRLQAWNQSYGKRSLQHLQGWLWLVWNFCNWQPVLQLLFWFTDNPAECRVFTYNLSHGSRTLEFSLRVGTISSRMWQLLWG